VDKNVHRKLLAIWKTSKKEESKERTGKLHYITAVFLMSLTFDMCLHITLVLQAVLLQKRRGVSEPFLDSLNLRSCFPAYNMDASKDLFTSSKRNSLNISLNKFSEFRSFCLLILPSSETMKKRKQLSYSISS